MDECKTLQVVVRVRTQSPDGHGCADGCDNHVIIKDWCDGYFAYNARRLTLALSVTSTLSAASHFFCMPRWTKKMPRSKRRSKQTTKKRRRTKKKKKRWSDIAPKRVSERRQMPRSCFLVPDQLKYPVCNKYNHRVSCKGIRAARSRAAQQHRLDLVIKARALERRHCAGRGRRRVRHSRRRKPVARVVYIPQHRQVKSFAALVHHIKGHRSK